MAVNNQPRPTAFWTDNPPARLFNEEQSDNYIDVMDEVDENAVTKKELRWVAVLSVVAALALIILTHGVAAIVIAIGLLIGAGWSGLKSRNIAPIVRDAKKHAWQAVHTNDRLAPKDRPQAPSLARRARAFLAGVPVEQLDGVQLRRVVSQDSIRRRPTAFE